MVKFAPKLTFGPEIADWQAHAPVPSRAGKNNDAQARHPGLAGGRSG